MEIVSRLRLVDARPQQARRDLGADEHRLQGRVAARVASRTAARACWSRMARCCARRRGGRRDAAVRARRGARRRAPAAARGAGDSARQLERAPAAEPDDSALFLRRHRRDPLDLGHDRPLEGRDAEPQRVDPRGASTAPPTRTCARARCSTTACRCTSRRRGSRTSIARSSAGVPVAIDRALLGRRTSGTAAATTARPWSSRSARCTSSSGSSRRGADDADNPVRRAGMVPMPDALIEPFKERFGIEQIHQGYGQSEVMALLARRPGADVPARTRSAIPPTASRCGCSTTTTSRWRRARWASSASARPSRT